MCPEDDEPWRNLGFEEPAARFDSGTQNARVWSEAWVARSLYCPNCGEPRLTAFRANRPVADFHCGNCREQYELKSQRARFGPRITDGAYGAMMKRLQSEDRPSLMLMRYDFAQRRVADVTVVPKQFFTPDIIEARPPLSPAARRVGWIGCKIVLGRVPASGKIAVIEAGRAAPKAEVLETWRRTLFLRDARPEARGWLIEVMAAVEALGRSDFTLEQVYAAEARLAELYPGNNNVRPKVRQQLQRLRDAGYIEFTAPGRYRLT